jgi:phosphoserine phosphatase RsbU/P
VPADKDTAHAPSTEALALLDTAACGLLQTTENGTFLRVNKTFCGWVGHPAEALIGRRRFQDLLTMGGRIFHQTHWTPLLAMQGSISEVKLDIVHAAASTVPMVLNAIRHEQGGAWVHEIAAYVARDRDKYERELLLSRKRLEELVAEATRLHAEAKDRALFAEQMIGIVSHDMRNPLSSIAIGAALLARGELSESQQRTLARIARSTDRASRLVADLLDFTQARVGKGLSVTRVPIDLHESIAQAIEELAPVYPARAIAHVRVGEGACVADANRLAQLVGNLVANAMAYGSPESPVTVTSSVGDTSFAIAVHNEGAPIPKELQATLFQPMTRGAHAINKGRSVGLGLFIVREIARAHGGSAVVASAAEAGTTFRAVFSRAL